MQSRRIVIFHRDAIPAIFPRRLLLASAEVNDSVTDGRHPPNDLLTEALPQPLAKLDIFSLMTAAVSRDLSSISGSMSTPIT